MVVITGGLIVASITWVVSPLINKAITKIETYIGMKYFKNPDIEADMKKMSTSLRGILSVMGTVEKQRIVNPNEVQLVQDINDAVYDARDFMDELAYFLDRKVSVVAALSSFNVDKEEVKKVNESLDRATNLANILLELMTAKNCCNLQSPKQENWSPTSSLISEKFVGREQEHKELIKLLFEKVEGPPTIVPIVGHGGVGKTTLSQMIINDARVRDHFDQTMWLTVSDNFDKLRLTKELLKDVCGNFSAKNASFNKLQKQLEILLGFKKILLVLDDVWYVKDDNQKYTYEKTWLEFLAPLKKAKAGSKIIITTRQDVVVRSMESVGSVSSPVSLDGLNISDSWELFKLLAFNDGNRNNHRGLEPIGLEIVKKLKGLPLAIRVVGTELRGNSNIEEWKTNLNDISLVKGDIIRILYRSYEHLPVHLQCCFAYCSLFPKNYHLKPNRLVHMWIAQGFVHPQDGKSSEKIAQSYLNELIARSFIQVLTLDNKKRYVMHDFMNELACHVSRGECYMLKKGDNVEKLGSIRHLSVTPGATDIVKEIPNFDKLRTLIFLDSTWCGEKDLFKKLKRIRVLDIEWEFETLPIAECKYIRYLCFRNYYGRD